MGKGKRKHYNKGQIEYQIEILSGLLVLGLTRRQIAEQLSQQSKSFQLAGDTGRAFVYDMSEGVIENRIKEVYKRWKQAAIQNIDVLRGRDLETIDQMLQVYGPRALGRTSAQKGEPDISAANMVLSLMDRRAKITGLYQHNVNLNISGTIPLSTAKMQIIDLLSSRPELLDRNPDLKKKYEALISPQETQEVIDVEITPKNGRHHNDNGNGNGRHSTDRE